MQFKNTSMLYMAYNHMMLQLQVSQAASGEVSTWEVTYKDAPGVYRGWGGGGGMGQGHMEVSVSSDSLERFSSAVGVWMSGEEKRGREERGSFSHRVAHWRLQGDILLGLAADVIEGEEQVVVVGEVGGNLHLYLLVELRGPAEMERGDWKRLKWFSTRGRDPWGSLGKLSRGLLDNFKLFNKTSLNNMHIIWLTLF